MEHRLNAISQKLNEAHVDAVILLNPVNRRYALGFESGDEGILLITATGQVHYLADADGANRIRESRKECLIETLSWQTSYVGILRRLQRKMNLQCIGFEEQYVSADFFQSLTDLIHCNWVPMSNLLYELRQQKDCNEMRDVVAAAQIAQRAFDTLQAELHAGLTERSIASRIQSLMLEQGADGIAFPPTVKAKRGIADRHYPPGDRRICENDLLLIDFGCVYNGYCSDITRMMAVGSADEAAKEAYQTVWDACQAAKRTLIIDPRKTALVCRGILSQRGFNANYTYDTAHGIGLEVHEPPYLDSFYSDRLPNGTVLAVEAGTKLADGTEIRIEDMVAIAENELEELSVAPKDLLIK